MVGANPGGHYDESFLRQPREAWGNLEGKGEQRAADKSWGPRAVST